MSGARARWVGVRAALPPTAHAPPEAAAAWKRIAEWRRARTEGEPDPLRRQCKRFFDRLDVQTTVEARDLWSAVAGGDFARHFAHHFAHRRAALEGLPTRLLRGLRDRASGQDLPYESAAGDATVRGWAEELSAVFREAQSASELEPGELPDAFELFARSALMLAHDSDRGDPLYRAYMLPACQPNSPSLFLFAELADLCLTLGVERTFWEPLRPTLVYMQKVFHETCRPRFGLGALDWSTLCASDPPARSVDLAAMRAERAQFLASFDLSAVWRFNVQRRVQRAPVH